MPAAAVALFATVFLACLVEAVEAVTIVLAAGTSRNWRSALLGAASAVVVLVALIAALGPALTTLPLTGLRLIVGALLLTFGLQWLRKAILRAAGRKAKHDEDAIFAAEMVAAATLHPAAARGIDGYAFVLAAKGVLLEGLEVAFIAVTFGANAQNFPVAAAAAIAATLVVAGLGIAVRAPLARVPENTLKFAVGVMLTAFGMFWGAEGAGAIWPGGEIALPVIVLGVAALALLLVRALRTRSGRALAPSAPGQTSAACAATPPAPGAVGPASAPSDATSPTPGPGSAAPDATSPTPDTRAAGDPPTSNRPGEAVPTRPRHRPLAALVLAARFVYDFVVGDDWQIALAAVLALVVTWALASVTASMAWIALPMFVVAVVPWSLWRQSERLR